MNSTNNSSTKTKTYTAEPFLRFTFRQNSQHLILYLVLVLLAVILPSFMLLNMFTDETTRFANISETRIEDMVSDTMLVTGGLSVAVSGALAILAGMTSLSYVNTSRSVGFYHSLPLKREHLFFAETVSRTVYYLLAETAAILLPYITFTIGLPAQYVQKYTGAYFRLGLAAVLVFFLVYAVFLLAASLTGTAGMRFLMVGAICLLPVALYALLVLHVSNRSGLDANYYLSTTPMRVICLPFRAATAIEELLGNHPSYGSALLLLPETILYYVAAWFLHKYRRSEASGTTVIWKGVFGVLRACVILAGGLSGALLFSGSVVGVGGKTLYVNTILGLVIGSVLGLLLANCVLHRSLKAMFRGLRSFAILFGSMLLLVVLVTFNVTGLLGKFYPAGITDTVTVESGSYGQGTLVFEDPDDVAWIVHHLQDETSWGSEEMIPILPPLDPRTYPAYASLDPWLQYQPDEFEKSGVEYPSPGWTNPDATSFRIVQKPVFGIPVARYILVSINSTFADELFRQEVYLEKMADMPALLAPENNVNEINIQLDVRNISLYVGEWQDTTGYVDLEQTGWNYDCPDMKKQFRKILETCAYDPSFRDSSPVVGEIRIWGQESFTYPVHAAEIDLINEISRAFLLAEEHRTDGVKTYPAPTFRPYTSTREYYMDAEAKITDNEHIFLVEMTTGEACELDASAMMLLMDATTQGMRRYGHNYVPESDTPYCLIYQRRERDDIVMRFRRGAVQTADLASIFNH